MGQQTITLTVSYVTIANGAIEEITAIEPIQPVTLVGIWIVIWKLSIGVELV